jgi:hypothetical protein
MKLEDNLKPLPPKKDSKTIDVTEYIPVERPEPTGIPKGYAERQGLESPAKARIRAMREAAEQQIIGITKNKRFPELEKRHRGLKWVGTHYVNTGRDKEERDEINEALKDAING